MQKTALLIIGACSSVIFCSIISCNQEVPVPSRVAISTGTSASGAGARIDKPFTLQVSGADCYSGSGKNAGNVAFGFPSRSPDAALRFTLGPLRDGLSPGQENNKAYNGLGDYTNVGIAVKSAGQKPFVGFGIVTVNTDEQSGTFRLPDGSASGAWDCGHKLTH